MTLSKKTETLRDFSDLKAEEKILKHALSGVNFYNIKKYINKKDFFFEANKRLFAVMEYIDRSLYAVNYENIAENLTKHGDSDLLEHLNAIAKVDVSNSEIKDVAQKVGFSSSLRSYVESFASIMNNEKLKTNADIVINLLNVSEEYIKKVKANKLVDYAAEKHRESVSEVIKTIKDNKDTGSILIPGAVGTGFRSLDRLIGGFCPGNVSIIGADSHIGKTVFLSNIALHMISNGFPVLFIALEGSSLNLTQRTISAATQIPLKELTRPGIFNFEANFETINNYKEVASTFPLYTIVKSGLSIRDIDFIVEKEMSTNNIKIVFIDHVHAISREGHRSENEALTDISLKLQALSYKGVAVIVLSQLNRDLRNRVQQDFKLNDENTPNENIPTLASIRGSDSLTQYADNILFLSRPRFDSNEMKPEMRVTIAKNRNDSEKGDFMLYFKNKSTQLSE